MTTFPARAVFATWAPARRGLTITVTTLALAAITAEALDTGFVPTAAATLAVGLLCMAALLAPPRHLARTGWIAVTASLALSLTTAQLQHRPEHTPGMTEMGMLLLLATRAVRHEPLRRMIPLTSAAWLATCLVLLRLPGSEYMHVAKYGLPPLLLALPVAVVLGLYLHLVDGTREREKNARLNAQRLEYARELHDFVGHHVTAITAQVKAVRFTTAAGHPPTPQALDEALANIEDAALQATDSMRAMVGLLRRPDRSAPLHAPQTLHGLHDLADALRATGPEVSLTIDPRLLAVPPPDHLCATAYHVVREALTNIRKHATGAGTVTIDVRHSPDAGALTVCVTDNAAQPSDATPAHRGPGGFGITGLRERVDAVGGTLTAGPGPVGGWQVAAEIPLSPDAAPRTP
ncbi:sensor histidine kinase [Streptomyces spectabilis]|uniref:histidine kinase n=1 Tax=Streptomyces spectabilis TaxID=68270 RepID=A0A5P2WZR6_STRST|nr:histidine kinase [Streptomyces spectabilis]MBB5101550.1 signal transduction histidine kinase [Streptomyces spectabilis]MCI3900735.1 histidine kinase [Streptomyces spectabilis]QEV58273.1 histidine kinase [Streptomyces spectabilis]GGV12084.1 two-component sensor histidine kinase [Streptomyces spectabilis]